MDQGIRPCIPPKRHRNQPVHSSKRLYTMGHRWRTDSAKRKDWRRIATRYDRCASLGSAILLAATVIFWL